MSAAINENGKSPTPAGTSRTTDNLSSLRTDQLDDSDDDVLFGVDLLRRMDVDMVEKLGKHFSDGPLTKDEFVRALESIVGCGISSHSAEKLFDVLDERLVGRITWDQFLDGLIEGTESSTTGAKSFENPIDPDVEIHNTVHCKREPIVKIIPLETKSAFCYAVISLLGRVGVYDGAFNLLESYNLPLKPHEETIRDFSGEEQNRRRSQTTWISDVVLVDSNSLLFASSDRNLHLYDANCLTHIPLCRVVGLQNVPTCLEYHSSDRFSFLFIGDECGNIITMKFHQPKTTLFKKKHPDKLDNYYWSELDSQTDYVTYSLQSRVHNDAVIQITYSPSNETILSCSNDSSRTLVIRQIDGRRQPYIFRVARGIKCFHYERSMHVVATGSNDFVVRVWNEVMTKKPVVSLYGHKAPIVDVRIMAEMSAVVSLSRDGVLKVWDVNDFYCQMTIPIQFPVLKVIGARVDFGVRSIYPGPKSAPVVSKEPSRSSGLSGIGLDEVETQISAINLDDREDQWNRRNVLIACSNHVAILRLAPQKVVECDGSLLPPPPREHFASAPSPWRIAESYTKTPEGSEDSDSASGSSSATPRKSHPKRGKFQNFTSDSVKSPMRNMNTKKTQYNIKQEEMKMLVEQCAPHLTLDLHDLEPITFSKPLPVTRSMKERGIDVSDPERVIKARLQKEPTVVSQGSSSAAQSPRSSRSSKSAALRRKVIPSKGRLTPDWFFERFNSVPDSTP